MPAFASWSQWSSLWPKLAAHFSPAAELPDSSPPPFILEHRVTDLTPSGAFLPEVAVLLTPALRTSGLLVAIPPLDLQTLLLVLSCASPSGGFLATPELLAPALGLSVGQTRQRLERLVRHLWQGEPLLRVHRAASGQRFYGPSSHLFTTQHHLIFPTPTRSGERMEIPELLREKPRPSLLSSRDAILAQNRALYGRPRAQVEAEIERFLEQGSGFEEELDGEDPHGGELYGEEGYSEKRDEAPQNTNTDSNTTSYTTSYTTEPDESHPHALEEEEVGGRAGERPEATIEPGLPLANPAPPLTETERKRRHLIRRLRYTGLRREQIRALLEGYSFERIERQLTYLPYRQARHPAAMLVASVEGDYEAPHTLRKQAEVTLVMADQEELRLPHPPLSPIAKDNEGKEEAREPKAGSPSSPHSSEDSDD